MRYFAMVAEEQHSGRVARRLNVVQSALSAEIKDLEEEIGTPLFHRTSHRIELTSARNEFLKHATAILSRSEDAKQHAIRASRGEIGCVRIGFSASAVLDGRVSALIQQHHARFPKVSTTLEEGSPAEQVRALHEDQLDLCLGPDLRIERREEIEALTLRRWPLGKSHALAETEIITAELLRNQTFLQFETAGPSSPLRDLLGFEPQTNCE